MKRSWVVLIEVSAASETFDLDVLEAVVDHLEARYPSALYSPDRCAVQFVLDDDGPERALAQGTAVFRDAAAAVGFADAEIVRVEVKTPAELVAEYHDEDEPPPAPADEQALAAAYEATRRLVHIASPREAVSVLHALVRQLGGTVVRPSPDDPRVFDCDISLGQGAPLVAAADPFSVARLCLEDVLPAAVDDARRVLDMLRGSAEAFADAS